MKSRIGIRLNKPARSLSASLLLLLASAVLLIAPDLALAQLSDKPVRMINDVANLLKLMGVGCFSCAVLYASYQMIFEGANFRAVKNIFWGGVLAGSVAAISGWAMAA